MKDLRRPGSNPHWTLIAMKVTVYSVSQKIPPPAVF